ncbi:unnamed protein product [Tilletia controversa]|uniref:Very long-chain fatty acid transport protein n=3 Tax=Tilletia TaxID=13289 RepID=A0A8X7MSH7_9BASI|nr:hypothetical protein CF335_g8036 [Tilletia laevis]KAE8197218.1 hypothetical protein CF328_g3915 [Tilletia controversa]KAE8249400.1 hypothetical protein A4X03_0g6617 [Tilletia caries]KAE8193557.1 hypothetical protein CF336_g3935 [Tilletia laevis]KAE8247660.1 hypothetical protein A4X06_0g4286 [Tilletia controversa]
MSSTLLNAAISVAGFAYLDAKLGIYSDRRLGGAAYKATIIHRLRSVRGRVSLWNSFKDAVAKRPNDIAYVYEGRSWTWKQVDLESRRVANFLLGLGLKPNSRVAIVMANSVAYPTIWLACQSANIVPGFINYSLTGKGLAHCINVTEAEVVIYEAAFQDSVAEIQSDLAKTSRVRTYVCFEDGIPDPTEKVPSTFNGAVANSIFLGPTELAQQSTAEVPDSYRSGVNESSPAALIFTSGTTGLPKAALCSHGRMGMATIIWATYNGFTPKDRIYTPMPVYHSSAGFLCVAASWYSQSTVIIGRKFSASRYWQEVRASKATVVQYIGEICRYLLAVPPHADDKNHNVRMAYGNGMRPDVWQKFRERFNVPIISEFYASSEGNGAVLNYNTGPFGAGAVGRFGTLGSTFRPDFKVVQVDAITEDIYRDPKTGMCVECAPDEPGEFLCRINTSTPISNFQGYAGNKAATEKKILGNVFKKGDAWFRSGDLMRKDADGFMWFGDRLGDTFRWRSENVSTAEVSAALGEIVSEANVYGVLVPEHDGRAGCAAIPEECVKTLDWKLLATHARKSLPKYAVPLFVRVVPNMEQTGTVKQLKVQLRNEGIDHSKTGSDLLYWLPPRSESYIPFDRADYEAIVAGKVKL